MLPSRHARIYSSCHHKVEAAARAGPDSEDCASDRAEAITGDYRVGPTRSRRARTVTVTVLNLPGFRRTRIPTQERVRRGFGATSAGRATVSLRLSN